VAEAGPGTERLFRNLFNESGYNVYLIPIESEDQQLDVDVFFDLNHIVDLVSL
jgi:hypothetical protein